MVVGKTEKEGSIMVVGERIRSGPHHGGWIWNESVVLVVVV